MECPTTDCAPVHRLKDSGLFFWPLRGPESMSMSTACLSVLPSGVDQGWAIDGPIRCITRALSGPGNSTGGNRRKKKKETQLDWEGGGRVAPPWPHVPVMFSFPLRTLRGGACPPLAAGATDRRPDGRYGTRKWNGRTEKGAEFSVACVRSACVFLALYHPPFSLLGRGRLFRFWRFS